MNIVLFRFGIFFLFFVLCLVQAFFVDLSLIFSWSVNHVRTEVIDLAVVALRKHIVPAV